MSQEPQIAVVGATGAVGQELLAALAADGHPPRAINAARIPDCAAQPACMRLVEDPSARYSMIPDAMLPAIPSADAMAGGGSRSAALTPAAAASAPNTAVG